MTGTPQETLLYVKTMNRVMKLKTGDDVLEMFDHSYRVHDDLTASLKFPPKLFDMKLVVRAWRDDVPARPQWEFRGFVHHKQLNAVTQYFTCCYFPELLTHKQSIADRLQRFFNESIRSRIDMDHYVIDFLIVSDTEIIVLELNPFYKHAGAGLFSWKDDRQRLMNGPFELRVIEKPFDLAAQSNPYANISAHWLRFMHPEFDTAGIPGKGSGSRSGSRHTTPLQKPIELPDAPPPPPPQPLLKPPPVPALRLAGMGTGVDPRPSARGTGSGRGAGAGAISSGRLSARATPLMGGADSSRRSGRSSGEIHYSRESEGPSFRSRVLISLIAISFVVVYFYKRWHTFKFY